MDIERQKIKELLEKIEKLKKTGEIDLSTEEDLSIAIMNLLSLEEHFYFTGEKTGKADYFDLLNEVRSIRKDLLGKLIDKKQHEGETWCISKHLLAAAMRLIEVGAKLQSDSKKAEPRSERSSAAGDEAKKLFDYAYKLYSLFWALRLKLIDTAGVKETAAGDKPFGSAQDKPWTLEDIVDKLVDCCDE
mgnify:CR=1 FL=1